MPETTEPQADERARRRQEHAERIVNWIRSKLYAIEPSGITDVEPVPMFGVAPDGHD